MAVVSALFLYPVKSLPGCFVGTAAVLPSGALQFDRRWAFIDSQQRIWNAKRTAALHSVRCAFDVGSRELCVTHPALGSVTWRPGEDATPLEELVSSVVGARAFLVENTDSGFPDDADSPGPTFISTATLDAIAAWFPGLTADSVRRRLRANVELGDVEPFWEDRLFASAGSVRPFQIGSMLFGGVNPCQRCVVPSRDPETGDVWTGFSKVFATRREVELPVWADRSHFNHFYRAAVNTRLLQSAGGNLNVGDRVTLRPDETESKELL